MGIFLGLSAALCWGVGDFIARTLTRQLGSFRALLLVQLAGFLTLSCYLPFSGQFSRLGAADAQHALPWAVAGAALNLCGSLFLYRAFEIGVLAIVSPICASYAAVTALLAVLGGETVSRLHAAGMAVTLIGVILTAGVLAQPPDGVPLEVAGTARRDPARGVVLSVMAALSYGSAFWVLGYHVTPHLGGVLPVAIVRLFSFSAMTVFALPAGMQLFPPRRSGLLRVAILVGAIDTIGFVSFAQGVSGDQIALVGVLSSLFSSVTVLLAWALLHERLATSQWAGILAVFAGVAVISA